MHTDIPKCKLKIDVTVFTHYLGPVLVAYIVDMSLFE